MKERKFRKMKKVLALILALVMMCGAMFTLVSCGGDDKKDDTKCKDGHTYGDDGVCTVCGDKKDDETPAKKTLKVATSPDFPPFENLVAGEIVGIEVEIMQIIADELGYEIEFEQILFDAVIPGVKEGKYDVGMSGISVTPDREQNVCFTTPYCLAAQCIVVKADSNIASKADLDGKTISVQTGTTAEEFCLSNGYDVDGYEANADAKLALTTGKVDAWVVDDLTAAEMCKNDPSVKILNENMTTEPYAFAFNYEDEALALMFDDILYELIENGTIAAIFERHGAPYTAPEAK